MTYLFASSKAHAGVSLGILQSFPGMLGRCSRRGAGAQAEKENLPDIGLGCSRLVLEEDGLLKLAEGTNEWIVDVSYIATLVDMGLTPFSWSCFLIMSIEWLSDLAFNIEES